MRKQTKRSGGPFRAMNARSASEGQVKIRSREFWGGAGRCTHQKQTGVHARADTRRLWGFRSEAVTFSFQKTFKVHARNTKVLANVGYLRGIRFQSFLCHHSAVAPVGGGYEKGVGYWLPRHLSFGRDQLSEMRNGKNFADKCRFRFCGSPKNCRVAFRPRYYVGFRASLKLSKYFANRSNASRINI